MPRSVDDVLQHAVYDPAARRERYLKSRQLKGRKPGQGDQQGGGRAGSGSTPGPSLHSQANQAASDARQVAAIKGRLSALKAELAKLVASLPKATTSAKKTATTKKSTAKPKTQAQKIAAKKALAKTRQAQGGKQKSAAATTATTAAKKKEQIAHLRAVIKEVESNLKIAEARLKTASNGR